MSGRKVRFLRGPKEAERRAGRPVLETGDVSKVQQQFRDEVDVNTVVRRFGITGGPIGRPDVAALAMEGDFTGVSDFESALDRIERVSRNFMSLPPEVRERFGNDVVAFVGEAVASDPASFEARLLPVQPAGASGGAGGAPIDAPAAPAPVGGAGVSGGAAAAS